MKWLLILFPVYLAVLLMVFLSQRRMMFFPSPLTKLRPSDLGLEYEDLFFPSSENVRLNGWFLPAPPETQDPFTILYCHGNSSNLSTLLIPAKTLHDHGFAVFLFDYREYGESETGRSGLSEEALMADAHAAYDFLIGRGIPARRVLFWGQSLGSGVAARLAAETPPAGLILEGSFPSTYHLMRRLYPYLILPPFLLWDRFETAKHVMKRTCPLLVLHAGEDEVVPTDLGWRVFESASNPKKWQVFPGVGHNDLPLDDPSPRQTFEDFVARCRKG